MRAAPQRYNPHGTKSKADRCARNEESKAGRQHRPRGSCSEIALPLRGSIALKVSSSCIHPRRNAQAPLDDAADAIVERAVLFAPLLIPAHLVDDRPRLPRGAGRSAPRRGCAPGASVLPALSAPRTSLLLRGRWIDVDALAFLERRIRVGAAVPNREWDPERLGDALRPNDMVRACLRAPVRFAGEAPHPVVNAGGREAQTRCDVLDLHATRMILVHVAFNGL